MASIAVVLSLALWSVVWLSTQVCKMVGGLVVPGQMQTSFHLIDQVHQESLSLILDKQADGIRSSLIKPTDVLELLQKSCPIVERVLWRIESPMHARLDVFGAEPAFRLANAKSIITKQGRVIAKTYISKDMRAMLPRVMIAPHLIANDLLVEWVFVVLQGIPKHVWEEYSLRVESPDSLMFTPHLPEAYWEVRSDLVHGMSKTILERLAAVQQDLLEHKRLAAGERCVLDVRFADRIVVQPAGQEDDHEKNNA